MTGLGQQPGETLEQCMSRRYRHLVDTYAGRSYEIRPAEHVGHVVTIEEASPPDLSGSYGHLRARCSCGKSWALDRHALEGAFDKHVEVAAGAAAFVSRDS